VPRLEWGQLRTRGLISPGMAAMIATRVMGVLLPWVRRTVPSQVD
jgi:hypothetical protein